MSWQRFGWLAGILAAGLLFCIAASAQKTTAEALFREALMLERAEGKLPEAIFRYERLIAEFSKERQYAAQAMYQLALAYEKLRDPRAKLMLTRLSRDYAGVEPYATRAREKLVQQTSAATGPFQEVTLDANYGIGSPDGKLVIYQKGSSENNLYVQELETGKERLLLDKGISNFVWSPDSRRIAGEMGGDITIVQIATGETVSLGIRGYPAGWTDSNEIFFYRSYLPSGKIEYYLVPAAGGKPRNIYSDNYGRPVITPDGNSLIVSKSEKLHLMNLGGGEPQPLTTGTGVEGRPLISPDGRLIAFAANPEGSWGFYVVPLDKKLPIKQPLKIADINEAGGSVTSHGTLQRSWTRDGLLTYDMKRDEGNIYLIPMDLKTGHSLDGPQRLTQDALLNHYPSISPDSKHIAYWYANNTKIGIAVMNRDGTNERPLMEQSAIVDLAWRGNEEILFYNYSPGQGEKPAIYSLNIITGLQQQVARVQGLYFEYVSSRNEILHSVAGGKPEAALMAFSLTEQKDRLVAKIPFMFPQVCVSADEKRIAYTIMRQEGADRFFFEVGLLTIDGKSQGTLIPGRQGTVTEAAVVAQSWSPDGKFLLLADSMSKAPTVVNVQTREIWPVHPDTVGMSYTRGSTWSPDGSFILFSDFSLKEYRLAWEGVTAEAVAKLMAER